MAGFTENALVRKLQELNSSQQSIQTLSLWLIHHRKHHAAVVKTWFKEFMKVKDGRQLTFMYLANDVIQNSKKKGPEYGKEFGEVLGESFKHMAKTGINAKTKHSLHRILNIWQERGVYDAQKIQDFKVAVDPNDAVAEEKTEKTPSKRKSGGEDGNDPEPEKKKKKSESKQRRQSETVEVDGTIETHTTLSPKTPPGDPPESDELVKALLELEHSASSDEAVRERIASLPPEVSEIGLLSKLQGMHPALSEDSIVGSSVQGIEEMICLPVKGYDVGSSSMAQDTEKTACLPPEDSGAGLSSRAQGTQESVCLPPELCDEDFLARLSGERDGGLRLHEFILMIEFQQACSRQKPSAELLAELEAKRQQLMQYPGGAQLVERLGEMSPSDQYMFFLQVYLIKDLIDTQIWLDEHGVDVRTRYSLPTRHKG